MATTIGSFGGLANNESITGTLTVTSAGAAALAIGRQGATSPALNVDASAGTSVTGLNIAAGAAGGGLALSVIGGNAAESITLDATTTGTITLNGTGTGNVIVGSALAFGSDASAAKSIVAGTTNGLKIGTAASQKLGFFNAAPVAQQAKADHNNWAMVSDVVSALVNLGFLDAA